jgi:hypothetical protein
MAAARVRVGMRWASAVAAGVLMASAPAAAYVEAPYTLGKLMTDSTNIVVLRVTSVDQAKNLLIYAKVRDIKGTHQGETVKHNIGRGGFHPREWQTIMAWAQVGRTALMFHNGGAGEVCIDQYWYQCYAGDWWRLSHGEPYLLRTFAGKPEKLASLVAAMLTGQEVTVPCMVDGDKTALQLRKGKLQRLRASLRIQDYNARRDFAGWGVEEFTPIAGMPGFTHYAPLAAVGLDAGGVAPTDLDGDGKPDLCLYGATRLAVLHNRDGALNEVPLDVAGGARAADWADFNGDGKPDLLLATPAGPRLLARAGEGFTDASSAIPAAGYHNLRAAAWTDYDGDGRPDILLADGFRGLRLYRNKRPQAAGPASRTKPIVGAWYYIGPFDNTSGRGFATAYPPEREIDLGKQYVGKNGQKVAWRQGRFPDGQVNSLALFGAGLNDNTVVYLYRELDFGSPVRLPVSLGSDDTLTAWLNGRKLLAENVSRGCQADQAKLALDLRPGRNALLLKVCNGSGEFAFYFAAARRVPLMPLLFEEVSDEVGLGADGIAGKLKGDHLAVADVNADGRADFLYGAGGGLIVLNTPRGFALVRDSGLRYRSAGVVPAFGDFDGDGRPDLFVPQRGRCRLFRNAGRGRFADVTARAGDLAKPVGRATCAAWADLDNSGRPGLLVGCLGAPNRYFRSNGNGTFADATEQIGLDRRIFNTRGLCVVDINKDGVPDVVFNNEGQSAAALLGSPARLADRTALTRTQAP